MKTTLILLKWCGISIIWITGVIFYIIAQSIELVQIGLSKIAAMYLNYMNKRAIKRGEMLP